jgi:hypothetical protein
MLWKRLRQWGIGNEDVPSGAHSLHRRFSRVDGRLRQGYRVALSGELRIKDTKLRLGRVDTTRDDSPSRWFRGPTEDSGFEIVHERPSSPNGDLITCESILLGYLTVMSSVEGCDLVYVTRCLLSVTVPHA